MWKQEFARKSKFGGHTWQSIKARFNKRILRNLDSYGYTLEELSVSLNGHALGPIRFKKKSPKYNLASASFLFFKQAELGISFFDTVVK